jgi:uncharacterized membrane protein
MNGLATIIACYGLLENSTAVVIGAMLIAMLLGPILGIALAAINGDSIAGPSNILDLMIALTGGAAGAYSGY